MNRFCIRKVLFKIKNKRRAAASERINRLIIITDTGDVVLYIKMALADEGLDEKDFPIDQAIQQIGYWKNAYLPGERIPLEDEWEKRFDVLLFLPLPFQQAVSIPFRRIMMIENFIKQAVKCSGYKAADRTFRQAVLRGHPLFHFLDRFCGEGDKQDGSRRYLKM